MPLMRVESSELRQVLEVLQGLDWVGRLTEQNDQGQARQVLPPSKESA